MTYDFAVEIFGITSVIIMVTSYALENISPVFIAIFSVGCVLAATYALLLGSIPFVIAEGVWAIIALRRWRLARNTL